MFFYCFYCFLEIYAVSPIPPAAHFCYGLWDDDEPSQFCQETMEEWEKQGCTVHLWNREEIDQLLSKFPVLEQLSLTFRRKDKATVIL